MNGFLCGTCMDFRFVEWMGRAYPCKTCGQYVVDSDGKAYGKPGLRYGNDLILDEEGYQCWANGRRKAGVVLANGCETTSDITEMMHVQRLRYLKSGMREPEWIKLYRAGKSVDLDPWQTRLGDEFLRWERKEQFLREGIPITKYEEEL